MNTKGALLSKVQMAITQLFHFCGIKARTTGSVQPAYLIASVVQKDACPQGILPRAKQAL